MTILVFDRSGIRIINGRNVTDVYVTRSQVVFHLVNGRNVVVNFEALKNEKQLKTLAMEISIHLMSNTSVDFDWLIEYVKEIDKESK